MTSLLRRKRPTTVRSHWAANTINARRLAAGLFAGLLTFTAVSAQTRPVEVIPQAPANSTVTVYYEKLPSGEIRPVSNAPVAKPQSQQQFRSAPEPLPQPTYEFRAVAVPPVKEYVLPTPQAQSRSVPIQFSSGTTQSPGFTFQPAPAVTTQTPNYTFQPAPQRPLPIVTSPTPEPRPTVIPSAYNPRAIQPSQPVTYTYHRLPGGGIIPVSAADMASMLTDATVVQLPPAPTPTPMQSLPPAPKPMQLQLNLPAPTPEPAVAAPIPTMVMTQPPTLPPASNPAPTPAPAAAAPIPVPVTTQPPALPPTPPGPVEDSKESLADYGIEVAPPTPQRLYRMESEAELRERIANETVKRPVKQGENPQARPVFPHYDPLTDKPYEERQFGGLIKQIESNYVCHGRLYLEELNADRYGWELGILQPVWSAGMAWKDMAFLPYAFATRPLQRYDCSAGKCYPGDPVPLLLYPPELSATGAGWEAFAIYAAFTLIP